MKITKGNPKYTGWFNGNIVNTRQLFISQKTAADPSAIKMDNAPKEFFQSFDLLRLRSVEEQQNFLRLILQYTPSLYPTIGCPYSTDNMVMAAAANM